MALVAPAMVLVLALFGLPLLLDFWMSLHNWPLFGKTTYIGLANYHDMFHDSTFGHSLLFTAKYSLIVTPLQLLAGYTLAVMVRRSARGIGFFRTVYFMPVVVGFAAAAYVFYVMLRPQTGVVDAVLKGLGLSDGNNDWLSNPRWALVAVIVLITWKTVGTSMILFMVGMHAIPQELEEAAAVDGAGWWARELQVILPLVRRTTALVLVITVAASFLAFDQFFILTQGGPSGATLTTVLWIYTTAFVRYRLGYSATLCVAVLVILVVVSAAQVRILREEE